jgi:hypothetical protein
MKTIAWGVDILPKSKKYESEPKSVYHVINSTWNNYANYANQKKKSKKLFVHHSLETSHCNFTEHAFTSRTTA